jgi:uncharacterized protein (TIGR02145 family)
MAENLNYNASGSKCYGNNAANCDIYGRLYDWATAMDLPPSCNSISCSSQIQTKHRGVCPSGWHIPSSEDWGKLSRYADGTSGTFAGYESPTAGRYLKATSGWKGYDGTIGNDGSTDQYGFTALPGGYCSSGGNDGSCTFDFVGGFGNWWSASEIDSDDAYGRGMIYHDENAYWNNEFKAFSLSVRCLKD